MTREYRLTVFQADRRRDLNVMEVVAAVVEIDVIAKDESDAETAVATQPYIGLAKWQEPCGRPITVVVPESDPNDGASLDRVAALHHLGQKVVCGPCLAIVERAVERCTRRWPEDLKRR
ncbi:MAG: hypothetical protein ACJ735_02765 [Actinomycetes bacterium]